MRSAGVGAGNTEAQRPNSSFATLIDAARANVAEAKEDIQSARSNFRGLRESGASSSARAEARAEIREAREAARDARSELRSLRQSGGGSDAPTAAPAPSAPPASDVPTATNLPTTNGQVLGGTTAAGTTVDSVLGDFTRNNGDVPIAGVSVQDLGSNADGTRNIRVTVTNDGPEGGTFLTPPWVAVQDGTFDIYDRGGASAEFLERLAEDGTTDNIAEAFGASGAVGADGVITGPNGAAAGPLDPGESGSIELTVDPNSSQFLSFASMVIPSNDAFISSPGDPRGIRIFDEHGNFVAEDIQVTGADVLDAGTEVNTEQDAAFLNQSGPNTGETEGGVVTVHSGFIGSQGLPATDAADAPGDDVDVGAVDAADSAGVVDFDFGDPPVETGFSVNTVKQPLTSLTTEQSSAELVEEAAAGNLYYNVHTTDFAGGEIRGQLEPVLDRSFGDKNRIIVLQAKLDPSQEPGPTSDSQASGRGTVVIRQHGDNVVYTSTLNVDGIAPDQLMPVAGVSSIHLHNGPAGVNGPVITDIIQGAGGDINGATSGRGNTGDGDVFIEQFGGNFAAAAAD